MASTNNISLGSLLAVAIAAFGFLGSPATAQAQSTGGSIYLCTATQVLVCPLWCPGGIDCCECQEVGGGGGNDGYPECLPPNSWVDTGYGRFCLAPDNEWFPDDESTEDIGYDTAGVVDWIDNQGSDDSTQDAGTTDGNTADDLSLWTGDYDWRDDGFDDDRYDWHDDTDGFPLECGDVVPDGADCFSY